MKASERCAMQPGCKQSCNPNHLFCKGHWARLSPHLQGRVHRAWLEFKRYTGSDRNEMKVRLVNYESARAAAIEHINKGLTPAGTPAPAVP